MRIRTAVMCGALVAMLAASSGAQEPPSAPDMKQMHEQMMASMQASQAKLDALTAEMHAATGPAKVDAVAAVVTELVQQHKAMHEHMARMHAMMGQRMMEGRGMMKRE